MVDGGNRGGPVVDKNGRVIGIAYASVADDPNVKGQIFPASQIREWFGQFVQTEDLTYAEDSDSIELLNQEANAATVLFSRGDYQQSLLR